MNFGGTTGGNPGDDTGKEYSIKPWYDYGWNYVLRYPNFEAAKMIAKIASAAANNDAIGYCQTHRLTYWEQLQRCNYNPSNITVKCEADCSSSTAAAIKATGYLMNIEELKTLEPVGTDSIVGEYSNHGFETITDSQFLTSPNALRTGDILLRAPGHVTIFVADAVGLASGGTASYPIDDIIVNLDEQNFNFSGTAKNVTYSGSKVDGEWIFSKFSQFVDFIVGIIINGIRYSVLGWAMTFESAINASLKFIEGAE